MRLFVLAALAGCKFEHGAVTPPVTADSAVADTPNVSDAPADGTITAGCNMSECQGAGGICQQGVCEITAANDVPVTCPDTTRCDISCLGDNLTCRMGMSCGTNGECTFHCEADHTCDNTSTLTCAAGSTCEIFCLGPHSCNDLTISCVAGATCIYHCCGGQNSCSPIACNGDGCMQSQTCP